MRYEVILGSSYRKNRGITGGLLAPQTPSVKVSGTDFPVCSEGNCGFSSGPSKDEIAEGKNLKAEKKARPKGQGKPTKKTTGQRYQAFDWCGTWHTKNGHMVWLALTSMFDEGLCHRIRAQQEEGGTTGARHFQMFLQFKKKITLAGLKRVFRTPRIHWEPRKKTARQADDYCGKDDTALEWCYCASDKCMFKFGGEAERQQGARSLSWGELKETPGEVIHQNIIDMYHGGASNAEVATTFPSQWVSKYKGYEKLAQYFQEERTRENPRGMPHVVVFFGPTGVGKTQRARFWLDSMKDLGRPFFVKKGNNKWWDGYQGERNVLINEFDPDAKAGMCLHDFLEVCDWGSPPIEVKGSMTTLNADIIVFTSNKNPREWYKDDPYFANQVLRRITYIVDMRPVVEFNFERE